MLQHDQQGPTTGVTPHLTIHDGRCREAIAFYERAFDAKQAMPPMAASDMPSGDGAPAMSGDTRVMHAHLLVNGGSLMLNDAFPEFIDPAKQSSADHPSPVTLHLQVDDADRWFNRAVEAGATVSMPLDNMFWGDRYGQVTDPFGHNWSIGASARHAGQ